MDLAARTLELVDVASESRDEADLARHVLGVLGDRAVDAGDTCVLAGATSRGDRPLVLLAGHLDTVPAQANRPGRIADGAVHGLGAADMKGAVAVMIELALADPSARSVDLGFVFFGREELPIADSALTPLLARTPSLHEADLAIVMEPTANAIQAGCLGNIQARLTVHGRSGHSARPWLADNAIHRLAEAIAAIASFEPETRSFAGLSFREALSVVGVQGGIAANVIPAEASADVNYRYAPGRAADEAERLLRGVWTTGDWEIVSNSPSGPVPEGNPLVERLRAAGDLALEPKQAWTPVAELGAVGVDAVNFGPGDPRFAHTADEQVAIDALHHSYDVLERFACA
ncbi:MAG TPA: succinyl-diaminopimelate desuccinylase [Solirubrobacteraceae bacterium]|nr:succinyl-diaminopimelate desuccinylase [Solirubrobacteraceae bacterium]